MTKSHFSNRIPKDNNNDINNNCAHNYLEITTHSDNENGDNNVNIVITDNNDNNNDNNNNGPSGGQRGVEKSVSYIAGFVVQG